MDQIFGFLQFLQWFLWLFHKNRIWNVSFYFCFFSLEKEQKSVFQKVVDSIASLKYELFMTLRYYLFISGIKMSTKLTNMNTYITIRR